MYTIEFTPGAAREFSGLDAKVRRRIANKIDALASDPRPNGSEKLTNEDGLYRIRVGDYRVIYQILDAVLVVTVVRVRHRREAYR